jgi:hypothetical protein
MTCVTWSVVDGRHFRPLCGNLLRRETDGPDVSPGGSCSICLGPKTQFGVCADCVDPPAAYAYRISMTFDGNGFGGEAPNRGCGVLYQREFTVFNVEPCLWESEEVEMRCQSLGYSAFDPVICDTSRVSRKRVSLRILRQTAGGSNRTVYAVTANWRGGGLAAECSVTGRAFATKVDCREPAVGSHYSSTIRFTEFGFPSTWANPFVNQAGGGAAIRMTSVQVSAIGDAE